MKSTRIVQTVGGFALVVGFAILAIGGLRGSDAPKIIVSTGAGHLRVVENSFDFGTIGMRDGNAIHRFELVNDSDAPLSIEKVYTSCMCTTASIVMNDEDIIGPFGMPGHGGASRAGIVVPPRELVLLEAVFDPAAHGPSGVGLAERNIYIETDSTTTPEVVLSFRAMVTR